MMRPDRRFFSDAYYAPRVAGGTFAGMAAKVQEQNLAVFGESGSGKTVLLSLSPLIVGLLFRPGP
jgi:ABC-type lipoprotein export system ATPase subunit